MSDRFARFAAAFGGILFVASGSWAAVAPRSFYESAAVWPPYNVHFVHDIGAFQLGLGIVLLLALIYRDVLFVVLAGVGVGQAVHAVTHIVDRDLGGGAVDPWLMTAFAMFLLVAGFLRRGSADEPAADVARP